MSLTKEHHQLRFPVERVSKNTYRCPCGRDGILEDFRYYIADDADPDWGKGSTDYFIHIQDPCYGRYRIVCKDDLTNEWVLEEKESGDAGG